MPNNNILEWCHDMEMFSTLLAFVIPLTKGQYWDVSLLVAWESCWTNNRPLGVWDAMAFGQTVKLSVIWDAWSQRRSIIQKTLWWNFINMCTRQNILSPCVARNCTDRGFLDSMALITDYLANRVYIEAGVISLYRNQHWDWDAL